LFLEANPVEFSETLTNTSRTFQSLESSSGDTLADPRNETATPGEIICHGKSQQDHSVGTEQLQEQLHLDEMYTNINFKGNLALFLIKNLIGFLRFVIIRLT
jgi:hypothetical protein